MIVSLHKIYSWILLKKGEGTHNSDKRFNSDMVGGIGPSIDVPCISLQKHKPSSENRKHIKHAIIYKICFSLRQEKMSLIDLNVY